MSSGAMEHLSNASKAGLDEDSMGPKEEFFTDQTVCSSCHCQARLHPPGQRILTSAVHTAVPLC